MKPLTQAGFRKRALITPILMLGALFGCAQSPTEEECKAGMKRMMEIQIDESAVQMNAVPAPDGQTTADWLKSQIPSLLKREAIAQCVDRVKRADLQCTMAASTSEELVKKCHWKVIGGPKGTMLGF